MFKRPNHCTTQADKSEVINLNSRIKRAAETSTDSLRQVFDDVTGSDQANALVSYKHLRKTMLKRRRLEVPGNPQTPEEFENMLLQIRFSTSFCLMVIIQEGFAALFASDLMLRKLKSAKKVIYDGTFYVVPKLFYQLFTIFIQENHNALPAIHILIVFKK